MGYSLGEAICQRRQEKKMTQDEFASRIGVTAQAVSKWERGIGLPDVSLLGGICSVLGISADILLGIEKKVVENGNLIEDAEIKNNLISEPIVIEFSEALTELIREGLKTTCLQESRKRLAHEDGLLLPLIRILDNCALEKNSYRILVYGKPVISGMKEADDVNFFAGVIADVEKYCRENYVEIINKNIVKSMIDNMKNQYPGVADGVFPEQISYLKVERKLKEILNGGNSIKDLIHILEKIESEYTE